MSKRSFLHRLDEPYELLFRIQRALTGYISYLAACEVNTTFTEYHLYEPILRVFQHLNYLCECEYACTFMERKGGAKEFKRIDFVGSGENKIEVALEVKWIGDKSEAGAKRPRRLTPNFTTDYEKLSEFRKEKPSGRCFLCVFGTWNNIKYMRIDTERFIDLTETGRLPEIFAFFERTQYGCRIFELNYTGTAAAVRKQGGRAATVPRVVRSCIQDE
ncbi:hypothetical protein ACXR0O_14035 [Verrucomicrobiota bacterium sgz303538]